MLGNNCSTVFRQNPAFGGFGSSINQTCSFGSSFQQSQQALGSNLFGSYTPFGTQSQPAFGATSTPTFGSLNNPTCGAISTTPFGSTSVPPFTSTISLTFGNLGSGFGMSSSLVSGSTTPAFGASFTLTQMYGTSSTPFGAANVHVYVETIAPLFTFGPNHAFGQSTPAFGGSQFGSTASAFGTQSAPFGSQATTPAFRSSAFGGEHGGTGVTAYASSHFGSTAPAFGAQSAPSGSQATTPAFRSSASGQFGFGGEQGGTGVTAYTTSQFGPTTSVFGAQSAPFGSQSTTPAFTSSAFGGEHGVTGVTAYSPSQFGSTASAFGAQVLLLISFNDSRFMLPLLSSCIDNAGSQATTPAFSSSTFGGKNKRTGVTVWAPSQSGSTASAFGAQSATFGSQPTTPALRSSAFGQSDFGGKYGRTRVTAYTPSQFGSTASALGAQSAPFGPQATTPASKSFSFGGKHGGTRVAAYTPTLEVDGGIGTGAAGKLESVSAMPDYKDKSHEELRWEDHQLGHKGEPAPGVQPTGAIGFDTSSCRSLSPRAFGAQATIPTSGSSAVGQSAFVGQRGRTRVAAYTLTPEVDDGRGEEPAGKLESISAIPIYQDKSHEELRLMDYKLGDKGGLAPAFGQSFLFSLPSIGFGGNLFSSSPSFLNTSNLVGFGQATPSHTMPLQPSQPTQSSVGSASSNFGQPQTASGSVFGSLPSNSGCPFTFQHSYVS